MEKQTVPTPPPPQQPAISQKPKSSFLLISLAALVLILLVSTGFLALQNYQLRKEISQLQTSPIPTTDPAANWETYTNQNPAYTIRYPSDWEIDTAGASLKEVEGAQLVFTKGDYKLDIVWPSAYGPSACRFSDDPNFGKGNEPGISDCAGEYKEFKSDQNTYRRLVKPRTDGPKPVWNIYTKGESGGFVSVPPISYTSPLNYDEATVNIMDQILSTFKFLD